MDKHHSQQKITKLLLYYQKKKQPVSQSVTPQKKHISNVDCWISGGVTVVYSCGEKLHSQYKSAVTVQYYDPPPYFTDNVLTPETSPCQKLRKIIK